MKVLITAGGTTEKIDNVRSISNSSTGRLGTAIAEAFINSRNVQLEELIYLCGQTAAVPQSDKAHIIRIGGVSELYSQIENILTTKNIDVVIHSMAVSDYTVGSVTTKSAVSNAISNFLENESIKNIPDMAELSQRVTNAAFDNVDEMTSRKNKISSDLEDLIIVMKKTPKVISIIKKLRPETILVGFKLLSGVDFDTLFNVGYNLLKKNNCDLVLANDLFQITNDRHTGYLISADKTYAKCESRQEIAGAIIEKVIELWKGNKKQ